MRGAARVSTSLSRLWVTATRSQFFIGLFFTPGELPGRDNRKLSSSHPMGRFEKLKTCVAVVLSAVAVALLPLSHLAKTSDPALDLRNLDTSTTACLDFYQFANGGWVARNPVPAAYPIWGSFNELQNRNDEAFRDLLTEATQRYPGSTEQKAGVFYATCIKVDEVEQRGAAPLDSTLTSIDAITDQTGLQTE